MRKGYVTVNGVESGLLDIACARIAELTLPAFIKDSQLRYVAVNDAYARFFDEPASAFPGSMSSDFSNDYDGDNREDRERRTLVFGTDESTFISERRGKARHVLEVERFITEDDHFYVFGIVELQSPKTLGEGGERDGDTTDNRYSSTVAGAQDSGNLQHVDFSSVGSVFDVADIGMAVFNHDAILVYHNETQDRVYSGVLGPLGIGSSLRSILECLWNAGIVPESENGTNREAWIEQRILSHDRTHHEHVDVMLDGRYIRLISRRQPDGSLIVFTQDVSASMRAEERLRAQVHTTEIYRSALEELPVAVFMRDADGRLTYANAAYENLLGQERSLYMGKTEKEMFPDKGERIRSDNRSVIQTGQSIEKSGEMNCGDQDPVATITRLNRVCAPDGELLVVGSIMDVSSLKAREVQLVEARSHTEMLRSDLETILQSIPVGIMILDENFCIDYVNQAFCQAWFSCDNAVDLIGYHYRDFVRANFENGVYGPDEDDFETLYASRLATFAAADCEPMELRCRDGRVLIIDNMPLSNGKYLQTNYDITAVRKREHEAHEAQAALERLGALMRDATGVMSQGLLIMRNGAIQLSNGALSTMLDVPEDMLAPGQQWRDVFAYLAARGDFGTAEEATVLLHDWEERILQQQAISGSIRTGGRRWLRFEVNMSGLDHWLAVFTDVTELKMREEELTRLLERAEAADHAKSEFLANMSHEIRTPMNGVLGMAELLARSNLDTRQKTFTDIIVKSGNALMTIINDILDFSKIDAGQMKLRSMPFDPAEAIEDVASLLSMSAAQKDIELVVRGGQLARHIVIGDAGRFRQIVTNLVGNAIKFTEKGHVLIDFGFSPLDDGRQVLSLRISDTGIGIAEEKLQCVFEKFSQVDASNTRRHEGTGLGLSITAGLVELFGGHVEVESRQDVGTAFVVHLPFSVAGERREPRPLPANVAGAHVLVIDDNAVSRSTLTEQLNDWGFDACACANAGEAFAIMDEAFSAGIAIDAVVIDYPMIGNETSEIVAQMRDHSAYADIPLIFLTSIEGAGSDRLFADLNVQAQLMKPPRGDLLRTTVIDVVRGVRLRRDAPCDEPFDELAVPNLLQPAESPPLLPLVRRGLDILVAEDNEVNQIVFTQILQSTGLSFRIAQNGQEAVEAWRTDAPAMILMDVSMPVMNGHQATRLIREIEQEDGLGQRVPIIGVTAHALDRDRDLCIESGMDDYLAKPISPELLGGKINRWFGLESARSDNPLAGWSEQFP